MESTDSDTAMQVKGLELYRKGNSYYDRGFDEQAIKHYDKSIEINPNLVEVWKKKGDACCSLAKYEESIMCYDRVLK
jgi:tetratricopeptide (TPR) repeat protein